MKLMIVHLSDIHIVSENDAITDKRISIVNAVRNLDYSLDICVILVTGDIAYSGSDEQYLVAMDFFDGMREQLTHDLSGSAPSASVPVHIVVAPGNHDCDFSDSGEVRDILINAIHVDHAKADAPGVIQHCTAVQNSFFGFLDGIETSPRLASHPDYDGTLCYEYNLIEGNGSVKFLCFNTAWLSQQHETQGRLFFPDKAVNTKTDGFDLVVSAFHHPYNWIESNAARLFRENVEAISDIIATGHEHVPSIREQNGGLGKYNTWVEGGVLQDNQDPNLSEFNVFVFETSEHRRKFANFRWDGTGYKLTEKSTAGNDGGGLGWTNYRVNEFKSIKQFHLSERMQEFLDDPGVTLHHQDRGLLKLEDIFMYPDLIEIRTRGERFGERVPSNGVRELLGTKSKLFISGDTESGKTCLAKILFLDLRDFGFVPVFLDGTKKPPAADRVYGYVEEEFTDQYGPYLLDTYRQLEKTSRAIVIDDYDKLPLSSVQKREFLGRLLLSYGRIIVFSSDITSDLEELKSPNRLPEREGELAHYRIQPFGYTGRNKLVERWMLLSDGTDPQEPPFVQKLNRVTDTLNTLVGKNYVPSYPVYVLAVLQALDASTPVDVNASTHGYFYELFIRASLARGRSNIDFDIIASYLAYLAFQMRIRGSTTVTHVDFREIHEGYEAHYDIRRPYESLRRQLVNQNILVTINDGFRFKYRYLYNYFVASYLKDHITESGIRKMIQEMSRAVHIESNANILMFLAHLSKDPVIINELLSSAQGLYDSYVPADLQDDVKFLGTLGTFSPDTVYEEDDPQSNREALLAELDRVNPPDTRGLDFSVDEDDEQVDVDNPLVRFLTALRQLEILGQVLKNFPGSLEGTVKLDIARECYGLGLRSLSVIFDMIRDAQEDILKQISNALREMNHDLTTTEINNRSKEVLVGLAEVISYAMVKRVAKSVGSRDLANTFRRLLDENETPAFTLINSALAIDIQPEFPANEIQDVASDFENNSLPLSVLRHLVVAHFTLFPVDYRTKQKICEVLDIKYSVLQRSNPVPRMLPRGQ